MKRTFLIIAALVLTVGSNAATAQRVKGKKSKKALPVTVPVNYGDSLAYAYAIVSSQMFSDGQGAEFFKEMNIDLFCTIFKIRFEGGETAMDFSDADDLLRNSYNDFSERQAREALRLQEEFLNENAARPGVHVTASGLQYIVIEEGEGEKPDLQSVVTIHYEGRLQDGTVFDSSLERGEPLVLRLDRTIKGWIEGVQLMSAGAKYRFYIPSNLAYGEQGTRGPIKANALLIFDVELISFED